MIWLPIFIIYALLNTKDKLQVLKLCDIWNRGAKSLKHLKQKGTKATCDLQTELKALYVFLRSNLSTHNNHWKQEFFSKNFFGDGRR